MRVIVEFSGRKVVQLEILRSIPECRCRFTPFLNVEYKFLPSTLFIFNLNYNVQIGNILSWFQHFKGGCNVNLASMWHQSTWEVKKSLCPLDLPKKLFVPHLNLHEEKVQPPKLHSQKNVNPFFGIFKMDFDALQIS